MLLAIRRYRVFVLVAVLMVTTVYYLSSNRMPTHPKPLEIERKPVYTDEKPIYSPPNDDFPVPTKPDAHRPVEFGTPSLPDNQIRPRPPLAEDERVVRPDVVAPTLPKKPNLESIGSDADEEDDVDEETTASKEDAIGDDKTSEAGDDRLTGTSQTLLENSKAPIVKGEEQFPVAERDLIRLPTGDVQALPKIQYSFPDESAADKEDRTKKQALIRKSFERAWQGYKKHAMGYDELKPLSKSGINQTQFMGWGATLVDTLDTLWIMGLEGEFDNAVKEVAKIDFTTSRSIKIPLFETVIRYLGGLLSAYELTAPKHKILLDKAVELADVLMGAFDTPNRMPVPFYYWQYRDTSQVHMSERHTVLAELGSLSMEFTKLAELTKENKYYDAVARVTDALERFQSETKMPGLWPLHVDSSGCKQVSEDKPSTNRPKPVQEPVKEHIKDPYDHDDLHNVPESKPEPPKQFKDPYDTGEPQKVTEKKLKTDAKGEKPPTFKPKQQDEKSTLRKRDADNWAKVPGCEPQGLRQPAYGTVSFGIGGLADSAYEYLPKMHALLGGRNKQYRTMYEYAIKAIKDHLLFRPMIQEEDRNILFPARMEYNLFERDADKQKTTIWEATHLGCFAGGMVALASTMFDIHKDLEIAKRLTDGCIWAYESTPSGVMPESFNVAPCDSPNACPWNEKRWHQMLEFGMQGNFDGATIWNKEQEEVYGEESQDPKNEKVRAADDTKPVKPAATVFKGAITKERDEQKLRKRAAADDADTGRKYATESADEDDAESIEDIPKTADAKTDSAKKPTSAKEDVEEEDDKTGLDKITPAGKSKETTKEDADDLEKAEDADSDADADADADAEDTDEIEASTDAEKTQLEKLNKASSSNKTQSSTPSSADSSIKAKLSHEDYVDAKIREDRLPPGYISIFDRAYRLRPEAIESVFIMWRLTGDKYWREKGWTMFQSIEKITTTDVGNAAVSDVTSILPPSEDSMESFWLAETLKYFYLLFSEPDTISLDDFVFNTEAHPFKIPKAKSARS